MQNYTYLAFHFVAVNNEQLQLQTC